MVQAWKPWGCIPPVCFLFCQSPICDKATQDDPQLRLKTVTSHIWLHFSSIWTSHPDSLRTWKRPSHNRSQEQALYKYLLPPLHKFLCFSRAMVANTFNPSTL